MPLLTPLPDDGLAKLVLLEVHAQRTVVLLDERELAQPAERRVHRRLRDLALARVHVKVHVQARVLLRVLAHGQLAPHAPVLQRLLVAVLHPPEPRRGLVAHGRVLLRLRADLHVDLEQVLDRVLFERFLVAVLFESDRDEAELGAGGRY